jgi:hypothetical protein
MTDRMLGQPPLDLRGDTVRKMSSRMQTRGWRRLLALMLAAVAVGLVLADPFPKGNVAHRRFGWVRRPAAKIILSR